MGEFLHQIGELGEQIVRIVGAGRGFRMVLHAEKRQLLVAKAFVGVVVQIDVCNLDVFGGEGVGIHSESMILGGDFHLFGEEILNGMIRAMMTEL